MTLFKQILAPTDFSRNSGQAINYACDLAKHFGARLHLLHVVRGEENGHESAARLERISAMVDARAELSIDTVKEEISGVPAQVVARYAKEHDIDLVVMGTHGRTGLAHLAMGSVAEQVIRSSPCPVLVLGPHDGETVSLERAAVVVADAFGDGLEINVEQGRAQIHKRLVDELRVPATTAILLADELEDREWIRYQEGRWRADGLMDLLEDTKPFVPEFSTDTPAKDLIQRARRLNATDLHIDPAEGDEHVVRLRIDGQLQKYCQLHHDVANQVVNQFKTMAGLDIADPFHPKEGRVRLPKEFSDLDLRLTCIPVAGGQAVALRLFDPEKIFLPLEHLGFSQRALSSVHEILRRGEGLVLITGPTGSGKTTTVYSMLQSIGGEHANIVSIEDPVEYAVPFARQMSVDLRHGISMTEGLRTILRMDPDVVFIGEIRDEEAAAIGMRAASTGKYVFSTMHTRDIASSITALRDLNLDERTLSSSLSGIINQRLVRRLCDRCKKASEVTTEHREKLERFGLLVPDQMFEPAGCDACHMSGFHGRTGVFEVAGIGQEVSEAIASDKSDSELEGLLRSTGTVSLESDALEKATAGITSFNEAIGIRWLA